MRNSHEKRNPCRSRRAVPASATPSTRTALTRTAHHSQAYPAAAMAAATSAGVVTQMPSMAVMARSASFT